MNKKLLYEFKKGLTIENPTFVLILGLCPTLAVSTSLTNAIGMGIAATFVLVGSNIIISALRNFIPNEVRIPCYIVVIATFVTITELVMKGFAPALSESLGIFVPLIVVNCIVLGRAEAFASKNPILESASDGFGMGVGFTLALMIISAIREFLGAGKLFGIPILKSYEPILVMVLAPGALLTLGLLIGLSKYYRLKKEEISKKKAAASSCNASCSGCSVTNS